MHLGLECETVPLSQIAPHMRDGSSPLRPIVLVVDDERVIADTLGKILDLSGYASMVAYDAGSALETARVIPPDLLITDVVMPGMGGVELAMSLMQFAPDSKVLLFSGQAAILDLLSASRSAGFDFLALTKPVHPSAMLAQVSEMVPRYATQYLV